jgi:hypothetical protein
LAGVEHERCYTQRKYGEPEIDEVRDPDRYRRVEQEEVARAHVDIGSCETRVQNAEGYPGRSEASVGGEVLRAPPNVRLLRMELEYYLGRENFEQGRKKKEMFACSSFHELY